MFKCYVGTGLEIEVSDRVKIHSTSSDELDGMFGNIVGWATPDHYVAIIETDELTGEDCCKCCCIPVVYLRYVEG